MGILKHDVVKSWDYLELQFKQQMPDKSLRAEEKNLTKKKKSIFKWQLHSDAGSRLIVLQKTTVFAPGYICSSQTCKENFWGELLALTIKSDRNWTTFYV